MFTIGTLALDVCSSLEPTSNFVVLPFRVWRQESGTVDSSISYPPEFDNTQKYEEVKNCDIVGVVQSSGRTYFIIKSDHEKEFSELSRASLHSSIATISQHTGKVFSTCLLFADQPSFRGINRLFFHSLIVALKDRDRCVVIAGKDTSGVVRVLQAVVGELSIPSSNGWRAKPSLIGLPPPPLSATPSYLLESYKRQREECPSPTSQEHIKTFLKCPKVQSQVTIGGSRRNLVTLQEEDITCIVCFDMTPDMLTSLCCGCLVCSACVPSIATCPVCRQPTSFAENLMLKRIINNIRVTCECGQGMSWADLKSHKERCNKQMTCPAEECRGLVMDVQGMKEHLKKAHWREVMKWTLRERFL